MKAAKLFTLVITAPLLISTCWVVAGRAELASVGAEGNSNRQSRNLRAHNMPAPAPHATAEPAVRAGRTKSAVAPEYATLAAQINNRLTKGRVVKVEPPLQEAPVIPLSLMEAFPNADPELFETMPVGVPIVTIEIPNDEAIAAGLVDSRGNVASAGPEEKRPHLAHRPSRRT